MDLRKLAIETVEKWKNEKEKAKQSFRSTHVTSTLEMEEIYKLELDKKIQAKYEGLMEFLQVVAVENGKANEQDSSTEDSNEG